MGNESSEINDSIENNHQIENEIGNFINGKRQGKFVQIFANGDVFEGQFVDDLREGEWVEKYASGNIFRGQFKSNLETGLWKQSYVNGALSEGEYENGQMSGRWSIQYINGSKISGTFKNNKKAGTWVLTDENKVVYLCDSESSGKFQTADGSSCGAFECGLRSGMWTVKHPDCTEYSFYKNGYLHGIQSLAFPEYVQQSIFVNNLRVKQMRIVNAKFVVQQDGFGCLAPNSWKQGLWRHSTASGWEQGEYCDDEKVGPWEVCENGVLLLKLYKQNTIPIQFSDLCGELRKGKREGLWRETHGDEIWEGCYHEGQREGEWTIVSKSCKQTGTFENGKKNGKWIIETGGQTESGEYDDDERCGDWVVSTLLATESGKYQGDEKNGFWVVRYSDGNVQKQVWDFGIKNGEWITQYQNGTKLKQVYVEDKLQKQSILEQGCDLYELNESGEFENKSGRGQFRNGAKHGIWTFTGENGFLHRKCFWNGKLNGPALQQIEQFKFNVSVFLNNQEIDSYESPLSVYTNFQGLKGLSKNKQKIGCWVEVRDDMVEFGKLNQDTKLGVWYCVNDKMVMVKTYQNGVIYGQKQM